MLRVTWDCTEEAGPRGSVYLPWPFLDVLEKQEQELLEVCLGQQAQPHIQASSAQQFNQVQEVLISGGPWLY